MSEQVSSMRPEELDFSRSFFGYDPLEVRAFVAQMNDQLDLLVAQQHLSVSGDRAVFDQDLAMVIDSAVSDISSVLQAARSAAKKIGDRAEHEASDGLEAASKQAKKILASAEADAYAFRKSAWDASTEMLESVQSEVARLRTAGERDALEIISDGERKAHRKLAAARRDSENAMQLASVESDRLLGLARAKGQQIIRAAEDRAVTAQEQVTAVEIRREELLQDVEAFHARLEGPSGDSASSQTSTVRVIHPAPAEPDEDESIGYPQRPGTGIVYAEDQVVVARGRNAGWADGTDSVRLVETPAVKASIDVDALELVDEVARLRQEGAETVTEKGAEPAAVPQNGGASRRFEPIRLARVADDVSPTTFADRESPTARIRAGVSEDGPTDELAALFLQLRMDADKTASASSASPEISAPERILSPTELYDRTLLPVTNRALRAVKRQLIDIQGDQTKAIENGPDGWEPEQSGLASHLVHILSVMEREAFDRGHTAAAGLTGTRLFFPRGEVRLRGSESFVSDLFDEVVMTVRDAREAGRASREISTALSNVYRLWRTDEAERRLRFLAGRAYHQGLMRGLSVAGVDKFRVEGNGACGECATPAGEVLTEEQVPMIPVNSECRCVVLPA